MMKMRSEVCFLRHIRAAFIVLAAFCLLAAGTAVPVRAAADTLVYDGADLFTDEEEETLEQRARSFRETSGMDLVIVTTDDTQGYDSEEYADAIYDEGGFGSGKNASGALFLIDMDNRELWLSTSGAMIRLLTDSDISDVLDDAYRYVSEGDYADGALAVLKDVEQYYRRGVQSGQYNYDRETGKISRRRSVRWYEFLIALAIAAGAAGAEVGRIRKNYAMKDSGQSAAQMNLSYRADSHFKVGAVNDIMTGSFVNRQLIIPVSGGGRGGRGGPGRGGSGGFHSGRSTTHHSAGGHTHGGGGRRF